jgi:hypothetical protein
MLLPVPSPMQERLMLHELSSQALGNHQETMVRPFLACFNKNVSLCFFPSTGFYLHVMQ